MRKHLTPALLATALAVAPVFSVAVIAQAPGPIPANARVTPLQIAKPTATPSPKADPKSAPKLASKPSSRPPSKPDAPLLPQSFSGWEQAAVTRPVTRPVTDPAQADAANVAALKEYGFTDALLTTFTRDGESLKIKAMRFSDASGAYGAYSMYRHSSWPKEDIGTGAASNQNRVLFWIGNVFVDAEFPHISAMSGSELRELAATIPVPAGNKALAPPILYNLPQTALDGQTTHYALGPAGYVASGGVLPPELVGFDRGAETATATYKLRSGPATLTVINYPTPQLAAAQETVIAAYLKAGNSPQHPFTKPLQDSNPTAIEARRSGPLVAVVSGDAITDEAHKLLATVHYEADLAAIPQPVDSEVKKTAQLLLSIVTLVVVMFIAAVMLALFLGGGRVVYRLMRGKPISSVFDEEFTKLDLR